MTATDVPPLEAPAAGDTCPPVVVRPDEVQLFRFSAVTWNAHRIHFDQAYARQEGYDDVLVQAHLHGAFLGRAALLWSGAGARLTELEWQNRAPAVAGDELTISGTVSEAWVDDSGRHARFAVEEHRADGTLVVRGSARTLLPPSAAAPAEEIPR